MINLRDLLILNLTLQVFDGLFSYQVFSLLGAHEINPFVGAGTLVYKTGADCDRFGLHVRCCGFSMAALLN